MLAPVSLSIGKYHVTFAQSLSIVYRKSYALILVWCSDVVELFIMLLLLLLLLLLLFFCLFFWGVK